MADENPITELYRPHAAALIADANRGVATAKTAILAYEMHCFAPRDTGAQGICRAALEEWKREAAKGDG